MVWLVDFITLQADYYIMNFYIYIITLWTTLLAIITLLVATGVSKLLTTVYLYVVVTRKLLFSNPS